MAAARGMDGSGAALSMFQEEVAEVVLSPGTGGVFEIRVNGELVWSRKDEGHFPNIKELKRKVRHLAVPDKDLGHSEME